MLDEDFFNGVYVLGLHCRIVREYGLLDIHRQNGK